MTVATSGESVAGSTPPDLDRRVDAAMFGALLQNSTIPLIGSAVGSLVIVMALWSSDAERLLLGWLGLNYIVIVVRFWLVRRIRTRFAATGYDDRRAFLFACSTGLSGITWGVGAFLMRNVDLMGMAVVITGFQAMVMGGVVTLGAFLPAFYAFALPAILPMVVSIALNGSPSGPLLALYNLVFLILLTGAAIRFNRERRRTWWLTFEKEDLAEALTVANQRMSVRAITDELTGLNNRRYFFETLETEIGRLARSGAPLSLLMIDVDHFKSFNDTYGHVAGDECLKRVAGVLSATLHRAPDFVARYGGEEFVGLLPETGHQGAVAVAERLRADIEALAVPHRDAQGGGNVTVSIGVVTLNLAGTERPRDIVTQADDCLYRAKAQGRNRVVAQDLRAS